MPLDQALVDPRERDDPVLDNTFRGKISKDARIHIMALPRDRLDHNAIPTAALSDDNQPEIASVKREVYISAHHDSVGRAIQDLPQFCFRVRNVLVL